MRDWIRFWAQRTPDATAIVEGSNRTSTSYEQLDRAGRHVSSYLHHLGLRKGDRIALLLPTSIDMVLYYSAAVKLGIILVPLNYRLTARELATLLAQIRPALVVAAPTYQALVPSAYGYRLSSELLDHAKQHATNEVEDPQLVDDDPLFILYTSGSSGTPKGVLYTHGMLFWNSVNTSISLSLGSSSITVNCMPPFHTGGWNVLLTPILHAGGSVVLLPSFDVGQVLSCLERYRCTTFMAVPTMLRMLAEDAAFGSTDLSSIDYMIVGGEAMPLDLIEVYHARGIMIRQGYGMTEVGPNLTSLHHNDAIRKKGSIGKPNMYVQYSIVDDQGIAVGTGQRGELVFTGPIVTPGYWDDKDATAAAIRDGWLHTGDIATVDDEGDLYIVDRIKNMYISGGENVYPAEVETILAQYPAVAEVAVVGMADSRWGEVGCAYIVSRTSLSAEALTTYCKEHIASYKVPKHYRLVDTLPKTATGKIDRPLLKQWTLADDASDKQSQE